jgi:hypothetical protein
VGIKKRKGLILRWFFLKKKQREALGVFLVEVDQVRPNLQYAVITDAKVSQPDLPGVKQVLDYAKVSEHIAIAATLECLESTFFRVCNPR